MITFKAQLAECRSFIEARPDDDGWRGLILGLLDRWQEEPDVNRAWETILRDATSGGREPLPPLPLIEWVIDQAIIYNRLCKDIVPKSMALEDRALAAAEKEWKYGTNLGWAAATKARAKQNRAHRTRVLGRQPKSAPQKRFIKLCREMLIENCGQPLDQVNEMLTTVVVGHELRSNAVRDALKSTTRKGRDTRR